MGGRDIACGDGCAQIRDKKLIPTPARTLEGLIFKARYAASHFMNDYYEGVMISIVGDLFAIAEGASA